MENWLGTETQAVLGYVNGCYFHCKQIMVVTRGKEYPIVGNNVPVYIRRDAGFLEKQGGGWTFCCIS